MPRGSSLIRDWQAFVPTIEAVDEVHAGPTAGFNRIERCHFGTAPRLMPPDMTSSSAKANK